MSEIREYGKKEKTKKEKVRDYLETGKSITPAEAYEMFGSMRLAAIICDLKKDGYKFHTEIVKKKNSRIKFARYKLDLPTTLFPN
tara:strand:- start:268 stop:522 length:255 start_codon:yes stop_codon:yes gene_type:complete